MVDQCHKPKNLENFVSSERNLERKPWKFFGRTCNSSFSFSVRIFVLVLRQSFDLRYSQYVMKRQFR